MSLINDALKRVGQSHKQDPAAPAPTTGLKPAEEGESSKGGSVKLLLAVLAVAALGAGGWFTWKALRPGKSKPPAGAQQPKKTGAVEVAKAPPGAKGTGALAKVTGTVKPNLTPVTRSNAPAPPPAKPPQPTVGPGAQAGPGAKTEPVVAATPQPPAPVLWPKLNLQGIFLRLTKPSARINGRNLYVGSEIEGARVVDIQRQSVVLQLGGETNVMTLGQ
jgi:hypothetical protein